MIVGKKGRTWVAAYLKDIATANTLQARGRTSGTPHRGKVATWAIYSTHTSLELEEACGLRPEVETHTVRSVGISYV